MQTVIHIPTEEYCTILNYAIIDTTVATLCGLTHADKGGQATGTVHKAAMQIVLDSAPPRWEQSNEEITCDACIFKNLETLEEEL